MRRATRRHLHVLTSPWVAVPLLALALALAACGGDTDAAGPGPAEDPGGTDDAGTDGTGDPDAVAGAERSSAGVVVGVRPEDVAFEPSPLVEGATGATLVGDPTSDGLYVLLGEIDEGVVFPTHTHPDDRITTVVTGTMYYSTDEQFDRDETVAYPAGSVIYTPAGTPHTMWARDGGIVVQESGDGPTGLDLVEQDT